MGTQKTLIGRGNCAGKQLLEKALKHECLLTANADYLKIWREHPDHPFLTYFGLNFDHQGIYSLKFYFHLFHPLDEPTVKRFLPVTEDFFRLYHLHDYSKVNSPEHSGCAFTVKFYRDSPEPERGFHYRLVCNEPALDAVPLPKRLPFDVRSATHSVGISHEYAQGVSQRMKRYFYFRKAEHKKHFADYHGHEFLNDAVFVEYAEAEVFSKINAYYGRNTEALGRANVLPVEQRQYVQELCSHYGLVPKAYGYYSEGGLHSVYLFNPENPLPELGLPDMTTHYVDTFGHILRQFRTHGRKDGPATAARIG
jgi:hypothetical protein